MSYYGHCEICGCNITDFSKEVTKSTVVCPNIRNHAAVIKSKLSNEQALTFRYKDGIGVSNFSQKAEKARQKVLKRLRKKGKQYESPEFKAKLLYSTIGSFSSGFRVPWDEDN